MTNEPAVSILCLTYNHEKYIRQCLDGFIMQKTNFPFEVIVHDDASTDNTVAIVREYEEKYPDIIKPIYETDNQYSKGVKITATIMFPKAKGKYLAFCEGDDFWVDPLKLQKQYDAMEQNSDCHLCVCRVLKVEENGSHTASSFPDFKMKTGVIKRTAFFKIISHSYAFQTSGYFLKSEDYRYYANNMPQFAKLCPVGDIPYQLYLGNIGNVYYIDSIMSCYRLNGISSWNTRMKNGSRGKMASHYEKMIITIKEFDIFTQKTWHTFCKYMIRKYTYLLLLYNNKYKMLLAPKYWSFFGFKEFLFALSHALFPKLMQKYESRKKQKHE